MFNEIGSDAVLSLTASRPRSDLFISALQQVELRSSIERQRSTGELDDQSADDAQNQGAEVLGSFTAVPVSESMLQSAAGLIRSTGLRSLDAIQLATALHLKSISGEDTVVMVSSDRKLIAAAAIRGLGTLDPTGLSADGF